MPINEYIQEDKIEDLLTKELDVLENAISDDNDALAICSREEIWKLVGRLNQCYYNRGVEDSLKCVPEESTNKVKTKYDKNGEIVSYNFVNHSQNKGFDRCRQQTIDNISKLLTNK